MRLGGLLAPMGKAAREPQQLASSCRAFEDAGFDSIWIPQAMARGFMFSDPFVALTVAATVTSLEVGTAVVQLPLYDMSDLAHRMASLAQLAPDRFAFGVGVGSTRADFVVAGKDYDDRFRAYDRKIAELRDWRDTGRYFDHDLSIWPHLRGKPPLLMGTWGKNIKTAACEYDGWIASATYRTTDEILRSLSEYRDFGGTRAVVSTIQVGSETDLALLYQQLEKYQEAGVDDAILMPLPGAPSLDTLRKLVLKK